MITRWYRAKTRRRLENTEVEVEAGVWGWAQPFDARPKSDATSWMFYPSADEATYCFRSDIRIPRQEPVWSEEMPPLALAQQKERNP